YLTGQPSTYDVAYAADGLDIFFRLVAQRSGELLVVSFTDLGDLPRSAVEQADRAEAEAKRGELERVFEQAPAAIAVYRGPTHTIELANATVARLWGRTRAQLIGKGLFEALPEVAGLGYEELLDGVLATGKPHVAHAMEAQHDRNGQRETVYWDFVYVPVHAADGSRNGVMVVANEVTAQVLARRQMQQLNQELEARVQERTRQLEAAQATTERQRVLHSVYNTGEPFKASEVLVPLARTEGGPVEDIYFDLTYQARYNETGQIDGFVTYATDVTEQVLARHERERQRLQLHRLFLEAPAAICMLDGPELVYELVNADYQRFFPGRALQGRPLLEALPELAGQPVWHTLQQVYHTGQPHQALSMHIPVAKYEGGPLEDFYFDYVQQPRYNAAGLVDGVIVFAFDITSQVLAHQQVQDLNEELSAINEELTATNEELNESNAQLTRTNVDLDTFVYTASHDLKAPITNIESIVLALRDTLPPAVQQDGLIGHLLDLLNQTVVRFQATINQLTDISRLQLAHVGPAEPVALAQVVQDVRLDLMPAIAMARAQLTVAVPAELVISFSPANLRSIVYNLLSNAIKYRAPDRPAWVHVHAAQTAAGVVLTVQDNGLGM
ncbi:MAG: PAS domain-containing protein, partial [Hymenobacter sp.]